MTLISRKLNYATSNEKGWREHWLMDEPWFTVVNRNIYSLSIEIIDSLYNFDYSSY
jgi:hypothetical protein